MNIRQLAITIIAALAINAWLFFMLGVMNRPTTTVASPAALPSRVAWRRLPEPVAGPQAAVEPPAPLAEFSAEVPEMAVEPILPDLNLLDLQLATLQLRVRIPRPPPSPVTSLNSEGSNGAVSRIPGPRRETEIDSPPRPLRDPQPGYPITAMRRGIEGYVIAEILIDQHGQVSRVNIVERQGTPAFEQAVRETVVASWRFEPGRHQNQAVPTWVSRRIDFRMIR